MKAKLIKTELGYRLFDKNMNYITSLATKGLSLKNCQAIERGYDLDELAKQENGMSQSECSTIDEQFKFYEGYKAGFQKALEILGDKKFSEQDMIKAIDMSRQGIVVTRISEWETEKEFDYNETQIIQSLQQTEWDVEIVTESKNKGFTPKRKIKEVEVPLFDADGCLILKRV